MIIDAHVRRKEHATVLLIRGSLVTALGMCPSTGAETRATNRQVSGPDRERYAEGKRSVEDGEGGYDLKPER